MPIQGRRKWHVSLQVPGYRAADLGIIEPKQHRNFYAALHRRGYLKEEPLDQAIKIAKPMKIKSMIHLICTNKLLDIAYLFEKEWKVDLTFLSKLTGINTSFFEKYVIAEDNPGFTKVADLQSYQS